MKYFLVRYITLLIGKKQRTQSYEIKSIKLCLNIKEIYPLYTFELLENLLYFRVMDIVRRY